MIGEAKINPGNIVIENGGVVVLPSSVALKVLERAERQMSLVGRPETLS